MADINFVNDLTSGYFVVIGRNPRSAIGNKLIANIFQITFMTNINDALLSGGYGGNGLQTMRAGITESTSPNTADLSFISTLVKIAVDDTVRQMLSDQASLGNTIPPEERIASASLDSLIKEQDHVSASIRIIPEVSQAVPAELLTVTLPL